METMAWWIILLLCAGNSGAQLMDIASKSEPYLEESLFNLLLRLQLEETYDTLLVYGEDCVFHSLSRRLDVSTVLVSAGSTNFDWNFSSLTLIVSCDPEAEREATYRTLIKLQRNRRLLHLQGNIQPESVCNRYSQMEQYNIAMVREDFNQTGVVYACRLFENPKVDEVNLLDIREIYIENFKNMLGKPIRTVADLLPPRSMIYLDAKSGDKKLTGYVANLITNFAEKVNASLQLEDLGNKYIVREILKMVENEELDIGTTLDISLRTAILETSSYPYILTSYCLMLHVPAQLPYNMVYAIILDRLVLGIIFLLFCLLSVLLIYSKKMSWQDLSLANILLNDKSLRGLLGQSFPFPANASKHLRIIFCILCFASIMITTMYEAYLQSFFTNPPSESKIHSFRDIGKHHPVAIPSIEIDALIRTNNSNFQEIRKDDLVIFDNLPECYVLRDSFNSSYSFAVTGDRWSSYAEQQELFKEPVFYFARDLCFSRLLFMSIPLRAHLPYRHLFEEHMMRQQEFGLVIFWRGNSFFDMVRLGLTPLKDLSHPRAYSPSLLLEDVSGILKLYLAAMVLSIFCFLLELGEKKWRRWRDLAKQLCSKFDFRRGL
ncbi:uncharacterized protein LOC108144136 [Drosophila elegans]|uniref:uncharacterized protein LOC108144136 n=1 Tax=Drosophila elegans TaxID=30023 RepID=UPI0007E60B7C|nr:uncharacterized protein LOC108144136 [Drosophila elegans]